MTRAWNHGIFGCGANIPCCLVTCCFPCVTSYKVGARLGLQCLAITSVLLSVVIFVCQLISGTAASKSGLQAQMGSMSNDNYATDSEDQQMWLSVYSTSELVSIPLLSTLIYASLS